MECEWRMEGGGGRGGEECEWGGGAVVLKTRTHQRGVVGKNPDWGLARESFGLVHSGKPETDGLSYAELDSTKTTLLNWNQTETEMSQSAFLSKLGFGRIDPGLSGSRPTSYSTDYLTDWPSDDN